MIDGEHFEEIAEDLQNISNVEIKIKNHFCQITINYPNKI
jgi:hypothetical protein